MLAGMNMATALGLIYSVEAARSPEPWETYAALRSMPTHQAASILFVGSSHAQVLQMCESSVAIVHEAFGQDATVIAKGGSGVFQHSLYLREFFRRGNTAETIIYFADPWAFYSDDWNEAMKMEIDREPLDWSFTIDMVRSGAQRNAVFRYLKSKVRYTAFLKEELEDWNCEGRLAAYHPGIARLRSNNLYPDGVDHAVLNHYLDELNSFLDLCQSHNANVIIVVPPTLLGVEPGFEGLWQGLKQIEKRSGIRSIDCSRSMDQTDWYLDHDHLNNRGVSHFLNHVLKPQLAVLNGAQ